MIAHLTHIYDHIHNLILSATDLYSLLLFATPRHDIKTPDEKVFFVELKISTPVPPVYILSGLSDKDNLNSVIQQALENGEATFEGDL